MKGKKTAMLEVTELLHEDHLKVRDLFFQFKKAEDGSEKEKLVKDILTELHIHSTLEEEIVYPAVEEEAEEGGEIVDEAETEHHVVKFLMAELSEMTADDDQFEAKVLVLCELVDHHIREEEKEMFKKLRESEADLEDLANQVIEKKEELKLLPLPKMECSLEISEPMKKRTKPATKKGSATKQRKTA